MSCLQTKRAFTLPFPVAACGGLGPISITGVHGFDVGPVQDGTANDPHASAMVEERVKRFRAGRENTAGEETDSAVETGAMRQTLLVQVSADHRFITAIFQPKHQLTQHRYHRLPSGGRALIEEAVKAIRVEHSS